MCVQLVRSAMLSLHDANSPRLVQNAAQCPRPNPPAFLLCAVRVVHSVCALLTSDGAHRSS